MRENEIQREILRALGHEQDLLLIRNNVGQAEYVDRTTGRSQPVKYGLGVGSPDLIGFLRVPGRDLAAVIAWEVKRPGEHPTAVQRACHEAWQRMGVRVAVVRSVDDARAALAEARQAVAS